VCIDKMAFNAAGEIEEVKITKAGVAKRKLK
jgi:hypothetical protein